MKSSFEPQDLDQSIKPTDDFFQFVNRKWIEKNPIPPEESRWGSFNILRANVDLQLKTIFEALDAKPEAELSDRARKVRDFYRTGMNGAVRTQQGDAPLTTLFALVDAIQNTSDLSRVVGVLHRSGIDAWWSTQAEADAKQSTLMALYLGQGGLGLPDRDYYLKEDIKSREIREKYLPYMRNLLAGSPGACGGVEPQTAALMDIETQLATDSMTRVELRDIEKQYNKFSRDELSQLAPAIDWPTYFKATESAIPEYVIVCQPDFMSTASRLFTQLPLPVHKAYLRWHILNDLAHCLDEGRENQHFDFYASTFSGATEMKPLWRRVQGVIGALLDQAVAELYVGAYFSQEAKKKIGDLVDHLSAAYRARIEELDWMSAETKQKATEKLAAISRKLGYPDVWKNIEAMEIGANSYVANVIQAYRFEFDRKSRQVGGPVDRTEWYMSPQTVNACYNPLFNEILFPAAILQPPFFDPDRDLAMNFGGIGTVIGHELTHGFDDKGALFDAKGNLASWWKKEDKERFDVWTERLAKQYEKFEALPGVFVNGELTLGENIADLGGLFVAYDGLALALQENGGASPLIDGLSPWQRFFISYAVWQRTAIREEALRSQVQTDFHAPSLFRVNGPLSNMPEFIEAFQGEPADKLWRDPEDRVKVW